MTARETGSEDGIADSRKAARPEPRIFLGLWRDPAAKAISGVAAGIAAQAGVEVTLVRLAFVVLSLAGGFGVLVYVILWAVLPELDRRVVAVRREPPPQGTQLLALGLIVLGMLLFLRDTGLWFGDAIVWPLAIAGLGAGVIFLRSDEEKWSRMAGRLADRPAEVMLGRMSPARVFAGALLVLIGMVFVLNASNVVSAATSFIIPVVVTLTGVTLIFGPWLWNLAQQLREERRERIRTEERAEMAAHLHDSVLQTLALIQRSDSLQTITGLARRQERELRSWLFGQTNRTERSLRIAAEELAMRSETLHGVPVEAVVVGDAPVDERVEALLAAAGEALSNAARHSGAPAVSLYVETEPERITAFVRDQGEGFDLATVPSDRRGITDSIHARLERHDGTAEVLTEPGRGTEVRLSVPRNGS